MHPPDEDKTTFITNQGIYLQGDTIRIEELGATFQRMPTRSLKSISGTLCRCTLTIWSWSLRSPDHVQHLSEVFDRLRKYEVRINPEKCTFGVTSRKFLEIWSPSKVSRPTPTRYLPFWTWGLQPVSRKYRCWMDT